MSTLSVGYTIGVFIDPLRLEFGWSRAQILATTSVVSVAIGALSFVVGWLTDRVNVRRLIIGSQVAFGLAFFLMAGGIRDLPTFYGLYLLMAIAGAATIAVPFAKLITAEFVENRGLALGLAMSGTGICGLLVPPYAAYVVEHFGWRAGYVAIGILPLAFAVPLSVLFLRNLSREDRPSQRQQAHKISGVDENSLGLGEAIKGFRFWLLFVIFTIGSSVMTALLANFVPILTDKGYAPTLAAAIAGSFGITVIAGRVAVGVLIDRIWAPLVGSVIFAAAAIAIGLLATVYLTTAGLIVLILLTGFAAGAEVDLMGFLVARYFGLRDFGKIYAAMYIGFALAPGLFTPLFGAGRDQFGSYTPSLHVAAGALAAAALLLLALGKYPENIGKSSTA
jgi:MFS family permease